MAELLIGKVKSIEDPLCANRIKVEIAGVDNQTKVAKDTDEYIKELPYCMPLLPLTFHVMPKVDEAVFVFLIPGKHTQRYYVGPIISSMKSLDYEEKETSDSAMPGSQIEMDKPISVYGIDDDTVDHVIFPKTDHITIEGRKNCGIQLTDDDVIIKAGVKTNNSGCAVKNSENTQSYLLLKYDADKPVPSGTEIELETAYKSTATLVADKINLIGNRDRGGNTALDLIDKETLISDDTMKEIMKDCHQLPFGDKLVEFLETFVRAFLNHIHPIGIIPPCPSPEIVNLSSYLNDEGFGHTKLRNTILSTNIRIN